MFYKLHPKQIEFFESDKKLVLFSGTGWRNYAGAAIYYNSIAKILSRRLKMDKFFELLRAEFEIELRVGGNYATKERLMAAFDRAFAKAIVKYAKLQGVGLT